MLWLLPVGFALGTLGTLVGAGGGFLLAPMLLLVYPNERPDVIASISLAVVFCNALSGTIAYARMGRVDYKSGLLLSCGTVPGTVLGVFTTALIPRRTFDLIFAGVLVLGASLLLWRPHTRDQTSGSFIRTVTDRDGVVHNYRFNPWLAVGVSLLAGYASGLLGIGGGIIHVPLLAAVFGFPVHIATATSHFALAILAGTGTLTHLLNGTLHNGLHRTVALGLGVLPGAQLGARWSNKVHGSWILRGLAVALLFVAVRLILQ
ncbi:MAG TPA: sulfite exporter TauE/SafE family protein [Gemmatimonadales bacterium]